MGRERQAAEVVLTGLKVPARSRAAQHRPAWDVVREAGSEHTSGRPQETGHTAESWVLENTGGLQVVQVFVETKSEADGTGGEC